MTDGLRVCFVCVRNAGRSQMAAALAERERDRRGLGDRVEVVSGGTRPADAVHGEVVRAMAELDVDVSDRTPRAITDGELRGCAFVATMGCSTLELPPGVERRDWALPDPEGKPLEEVRAIRGDIADRVAALFDDVERRLDGRESV